VTKRQNANSGATTPVDECKNLSAIMDVSEAAAKQVSAEDPDGSRIELISH
jgi:hypothetical protein